MTIIGFAVAFIAEGSPFTRARSLGKFPGRNERESHPETEITGAAAARPRRQPMSVFSVDIGESTHETAPSKTCCHIKVMPSL